MKFGAGFGLAMLLSAAGVLAQDAKPFNCPTEPNGYQAPYHFWWDGSPPPPVEQV